MNSDSSTNGTEEIEALPGEIILSGVSKCFRRFSTTGRKSYSTLKSSLISVFNSSSKQNLETVFTVLDDVSLRVEPGRSLGVIGRNGSGKSTILKLIAGIYRPDSGSVQTSGRISALIELGAGFHPDFTGRENLILGGVMYGLTRKEIEAKLPEIIAFAELEDFIDDPVRTYSSGMYMRLGFSLAVHTEPDILLVDEVLAVGDAAFVKRCRETIGELKRKGTTLLLVTHDLDSVERWCDEALWLADGKVVKRGEPRWVIDSYLEEISNKERAELSDANEEALPKETDTEESGEGARRWGSQEVELKSVVMKAGRVGSSLEPTWVFAEDDRVQIEVDYVINKPIESLVLGIGLLRSDGLVVHGNNTEIDKISVPTPSKRIPISAYPLTGSFSYSLDRLGLLDGSYYLDLAAHSEDGLPYDYHHMLHKFSLSGTAKLHGVFSPQRDWNVSHSYETDSSVGPSSVEEGRKVSMS